MNFNISKINLKNKKTGKTSSLRWMILGLLVLAMVNSYIDRGNMSMVAPLLTDFLNLDAQRKGYIFSAFLLGYTLMQIPAGRLVDRYGIKNTYAISYFVWGITAALFGLAVAFWHFIVLRIMLGVLESISGPAGNAYIAQNFKDEERGFASGLLLSGTKIGPAVGAILAGFLIDSFGWRMLFVICGIAPLVWLIPWLFLYKKQERLEQNRSLNLTKLEKEELITPEKVTVAQLFQNKKTWGIFLGYLFYGYVWFLYISWLPSYLFEVRGFSITETGWWSGFAYGSLALVVILAGWFADKLIKKGNTPTKIRKRFVVAGFLCGSLILPVPFIQNTTYAISLIVFAISGMGLATANTWAITQSIAPKGTIGTLAGIQNFGATLGGLIAPILTGFLIQRTNSYHTAFVLAGLCMICGILCYLFLIGKVEPLKIKK